MRLYLILPSLSSLTTSPCYFFPPHWPPLLEHSGQGLTYGFCTCFSSCLKYFSYEQWYISPTLGICQVFNFFTRLFHLLIYFFIVLHSIYRYLIYFVHLLSISIHYNISINGKIFVFYFSLINNPSYTPGI